MDTTYLIVEITVTNQDLYEEYRKNAGSLLRELGGGGRIIARGGKFGTADTRSIEGDWMPDRFVIVEFPSRKAADDFYYSPEYQEALAMRQASSISKAMFITPGEE